MSNSKPLVEDKLADLLLEANQQPESRAAFYAHFLNSTLYVLTDNPQSNAGLPATAEQGITLMHWQMQDGTWIIPCFSSVNVLERAVKAHPMQAEPSDNLSQPQALTSQQFVAMPANTLLEMIRGETLFLNPNSEFSKLFYADEIAYLLTGSHPALPKVINLPDQALRLQTLSLMPDELKNHAETVLKSVNSIRRGFMAKAFDEEAPEGVYLLGIEFGAELNDAEIDEVIMQVGEKITDVLADDEMLDICVIQTQGCQVSQFFLEHVPAFYQRKLGSFLRNTITINNI